jgi:hypothetical protein
MPGAGRRVGTGGRRSTPRRNSPSTSGQRRRHSQSARYDVWKGSDKTITNFSIVTAAAAPSTSRYHDRMPLVLEEGQFEDWMRGHPSSRPA